MRLYVLREGELAQPRSQLLRRDFHTALQAVRGQEVEVAAATSAKPRAHRNLQRPHSGVGMRIPGAQ
eukprot:3375901-Alexandrium_andersonii.AAC.1